MKILGTAAALVLMGGAPAFAASLLIDDFSTNQRVTDLPQGGIPDSSQVASGTAIGGYRDMEVRTASSEEDATELRAFNGILGFSNITGTTGEGWVTYDGDDDPLTVNTSGLGGLNFDLPEARFVFDVLEYDHDMFFEARVWDTMGGFSSFGALLPRDESRDTLFLDLFAFSGDVDFSSVGALQFYVRAEAGETALDGALDEIRLEYIPLPASALLLLGGFGGLSVLGARRRKRA